MSARGGSTWDGAYVYAAEDGRLTAQRAPTREREQAEQLAEALCAPEATAAVEATALAEAEELLEHAEDVATPFELVAKFLRLLAEGADPTELARYAAALLTFLRQYIQEGRHRDALRLASLLVGAFLYMKKWVWIVETLRLARQAVEAVGDGAGAAWVVHDLGTLAASASAKPLAADLLDQTKDLYEQAGDHAAAEASSKIVAQVAPSGVPTGAIVAAAVGAVVVAGAAPGFVLGGGTRRDTRVRTRQSLPVRRLLRASRLGSFNYKGSCGRSSGEPALGLVRERVRACEVERRGHLDRLRDGEVGRRATVGT